MYVITNITSSSSLQSTISPSRPYCTRFVDRHLVYENASKKTKCLVGLPNQSQSQRIITKMEYLQTANDIDLKNGH